MTYRELYAQNCARVIGKGCHIGRCPDTWLAELTHEKRIRVSCPPDGSTPACSQTVRTECARCWDQEIPAEAALPEWAKVPDATLSVTVTGDNVHAHADGDPANVINCLLGAVNAIGKYIYAAANDWKSGEELIHMLQEALKPTSAIWDFSEGGGGDAES